MRKVMIRKRLMAGMLAGMMLLSGCGKSENGTTEDRQKNTITEAENEKTDSEISEEKGDYLTVSTGKTSALGKDLTAKDVTDPTEDARNEFIKNTANLSFDIMKARTKADSGKNVMISPDSIISALAMTLNGADGNTQAEMLKVLGGKLSEKEYNEALSSYNRMLSDSDSVIFRNANSIWVRNREDLKVKKDFVQTNKDYYNADLYVSDFDQATVTDINGWVNENTNGMINKVIDNIQPDSMMYLINAVAFEAEWAEQYEDYQVKKDEKFTNSDGKKEDAAFLSSKESGLIELNGGTGFAKAYKGFDYYFVAILPPEGTSAEDYIASLKGEDFVNAYRNRDYEPDIFADLPEFSYDYSTSLTDTLKDLGMSDAFSDNADFSRITDPDMMKLKIDDVIHKTHIELDQYGTKAAAVTAIALAGNAAPVEKRIVEIKLNRPFVYAIVDDASGLPVFLGTVNSLAE
ncbi:MAG: serpin family protein [Eubacterium sp.]|nr:serpin family protein [Eubacterium sp.]